MDYEKIIHSLVDAFIDNPEVLIVREEPGNSGKDVTILVCAETSDTAKLIGRKGSVANALREVISIAGKNNDVHIHLKFESFGDDTTDETEI